MTDSDDSFDLNDEHGFVDAVGHTPDKDRGGLDVQASGHHHHDDTPPPALHQPPPMEPTALEEVRSLSSGGYALHSSPSHPHQQQQQQQQHLSASQMTTGSSSDDQHLAPGPLTRSATSSQSGDQTLLRQRAASMRRMQERHQQEYLERQRLEKAREESAARERERERQQIEQEEQERAQVKKAVEARSKPPKPKSKPKPQQQQLVEQQQQQQQQQQQGDASQLSASSRSVHYQQQRLYLDSAGSGGVLSARTITTGSTASRQHPDDKPVVLYPVTDTTYAHNPYSGTQRKVAPPKSRRIVPRYNIHSPMIVKPSEMAAATSGSGGGSGGSEFRMNPGVVPSLQSQSRRLVGTRLMDAEERAMTMRETRNSKKDSQQQQQRQRQVDGDLPPGTFNDTTRSPIRKVLPPMETTPQHQQSSDSPPKTGDRPRHLAPKSASKFDSPPDSPASTARYGAPPTTPRSTHHGAIQQKALACMRFAILSDSACAPVGVSMAGQALNPDIGFDTHGAGNSSSSISSNGGGGAGPAAASPASPSASLRRHDSENSTSASLMARSKRPRCVAALFSLTHGSRPGVYVIEFDGGTCRGVYGSNTTTRTTDKKFYVAAVKRRQDDRSPSRSPPQDEHRDSATASTITRGDDDEDDEGHEMSGRVLSLHSASSTPRTPRQQQLDHSSHKRPSPKKSTSKSMRKDKKKKKKPEIEITMLATDAIGTPELEQDFEGVCFEWEVRQILYPRRADGHELSSALIGAPLHTIQHSPRVTFCCTKFPKRVLVASQEQHGGAFTLSTMALDDESFHGNDPRHDGEHVSTFALVVDSHFVDDFQRSLKKSYSQTGSGSGSGSGSGAGGDNASSSSPGAAAGRIGDKKKHFGGERSSRLVRHSAGSADILTEMPRPSQFTGPGPDLTGVQFMLRNIVVTMESCLPPSTVLYRVTETVIDDDDDLATLTASDPESTLQLYGSHVSWRFYNDDASLTISVSAKFRGAADSAILIGNSSLVGLPSHLLPGGGGGAGANGSMALSILGASIMGGGGGGGGAMQNNSNVNLSGSMLNTSFAATAAASCASPSKRHFITDLELTEQVPPGATVQFFQGYVLGEVAFSYDAF